METPDERAHLGKELDSKSPAELAACGLSEMRRSFAQGYLFVSILSVSVSGRAGL